MPLISAVTLKESYRLFMKIVQPRPLIFNIDLHRIIYVIIRLVPHEENLLRSNVLLKIHELQKVWLLT